MVKKLYEIDCYRFIIFVINVSVLKLLPLNFDPVLKKFKPKGQCLIKNITNILRIFQLTLELLGMFSFAFSISIKE